MQGLRHDIRYAMRALLKTPGFTGIAVLTLALGIGGSTAIFTLVQALLLKPLPFKDPASLMMIHLSGPDPQAGPNVYREMVWSYPKYQAFKANQQSFADMALFGQNDWNLTGTGDPERVRAEFIDSRYLTVLGIAPQLGRDIRPEEDTKPGMAPLALISHGLWQRRFGGDPNVVGRTLGLNAIPHTIIGVLPAGFQGLTGEAQLWVPMMSSSNAAASLSSVNNVWSHAFYLVARRKPTVSIAQAQADAVLAGQRVNALYQPPKIFDRVGGFGAYAVPLNDARVDALMRRAVFVLLGAVGAVLLIGCVNLANLMLTRALTRQREVAIRLAIGATRGRIVRQFLTESLIVAIAGAALGLLVAYSAIAMVGALMPEASLVLPRANFLVTRIGVGLIGLDYTTAAFALGLAGVTAMLFGLMPAWQASRSDVAQTIKASGAGSIGTGHRAGVRNLLIVAETALALVLLVAAGLMLTSVRNLQSTGLGFQPDNLILSWVTLPGRSYDQARQTQFFTRLQQELRAQPGVQAVAYGNCAPVSGGCNSTAAEFPDRPNRPGDVARDVGIIWASPEYFETLGIRLVKGRFFTDRDRAGQPKVVIVNETAARTLWPGEDPIGKRIRLGQGAFWEGNGGEVVGVVADVRYRAVEAAMAPDAYAPLLQSPRASGFMFIRTTLEVGAMTASLRSVLRKLDPDLPVWNVKTMGNRFGDATWRTRLSADLLTLFAALALMLAAIGLYGVMAQGVEQRTREFGVRIALGADRGSIFRLVIGRALIISTIGVAVGVALAMMSTPFLEALLYQVKPNDPLTIAVLAIVLIAVTLLASYVPARRATRVDPLTSLRAE